VRFDRHEQTRRTLFIVLNQWRSAWLFLLVTQGVLVDTPATAVPLLFTDRAVFNAAVGDTILITFDEPLSFQPSGPSFTDQVAIVDGIFRVGGDHAGLVPATTMQPGSVGLVANTGFGAGTLDPVLAFGVDVTPHTPICGPTCDFVIAGFGMAGTSFRITQPQFIGFLFTEPTSVGISASNFGLVVDSTPYNIFSRIAIDNVAIKTVPEPSILFLLGLSLTAVIVWQILHAKSSAT
jgi:hypothetical protein